MIESALANFKSGCNARLHSSRLGVAGQKDAIVMSAGFESKQQLLIGIPTFETIWIQKWSLFLQPRLNKVEKPKSCPF